MSIGYTGDVDITVDLSPKALPRNGFNIGMILGKTTVISTDTRVTAYASPDDMLQAGFATSDTLYKAAVAYYNQDDNLGASLSQIYIGAVGADEEYAVALQDCRAKSNAWYGFAIADAVADEKLEAVADAVESMDATLFFLTSTSEAVQNNTEDNLFATLKSKSYRRTIPFWHTDALASCYLLGYAMGANTGLINSAYTLKFKQLTGLLPTDQLTTQQVNNIEGNNGNIYITRARAQFEQGTCCDGTWADEMINLDKLVNDCQLNIYDLLYSLPKEPQTEAGQTDIAGVIGQACAQALRVGFLATGKWRRASILDLSKGDIVPNGYLIQWEAVDDQSDADRDARKAQPFYVCLTLAGAIHSVVVKIMVSR